MRAHLLFMEVEYMDPVLADMHVDMFSLNKILIAIYVGMGNRYPWQWIFSA